MSGRRLYRVSGREEIVRRRKLVAPGHAVEAWEDHHIPGDFWLGEESKALLDAVGIPLPARLIVDAAAVPIYYGPRIRDHGSLPPEESVQARVLSGHGIAAAWITLDRFGERISYEPQSLTDPVFYLRRVGGGAAHVWRRFASRREATDYMAEAYGTDAEAIAWAEELPAEDHAELLARYAAPGPDGA